MFVQFASKGNQKDNHPFWGVSYFTTHPYASLTRPMCVGMLGSLACLADNQTRALCCVRDLFRVDNLEHLGKARFQRWSGCWDPVPYGEGKWYVAHAGGSAWQFRNLRPSPTAKTHGLRRTLMARTLSGSTLDPGRSFSVPILKEHNCRGLAIES